VAHRQAKATALSLSGISSTKFGKSSVRKRTNLSVVRDFSKNNGPIKPPIPA